MPDGVCHAAANAVLVSVQPGKSIVGPGFKETKRAL